MLMYRVTRLKVLPYWFPSWLVIARTGFFCCVVKKAWTLPWVTLSLSRPYTKIDCNSSTLVPNRAEESIVVLSLIMYSSMLSLIVRDQVTKVVSVLKNHYLVIAGRVSSVQLACSLFLFAKFLVHHLNCYESPKEFKSSIKPWKIPVQFCTKTIPNIWTPVSSAFGVY